MAKPASIDAYLAGLTSDKRASLEKLRRAIKAAAPGAEECISYQLPAFRLDGKILVWFGAAQEHCSFYPGAAPLAAHRSEPAAHKASKGASPFPTAEPLPATLVKKL